MKDKTSDETEETVLHRFHKAYFYLYYTINLKGSDIPRIPYLDRYTPTVYTYTCKGFSLNKEG